MNIADLVKHSERLIEANKTAYVDPDTLKMAEAIVKMSQCPLGVYCVKHNFQHGAEAAELRSGIEKLLLLADDDRDGRLLVSADWLQELLDRVDARDSLAFIEATKDEDNE